MRKGFGSWTARLTAAGLLLAPLAAAQAQEPAADASVSQFAYATNIIHKNGDDYMYLVGAERTSHATGRTRTTAYAKRAKCLTMDTKRMKLIVCAAFVFPRRIPDGAFEFDPLMDSAQVRIRGKGAPTAMRWTGRGTPEPNVAPFADASYGAGAYGELYRNARAAGKILGEHYPRGRMGFAVLMEGALAEAYTGEGVTITPTDNGGYEVTATYRIPR